MNVKRYSLTQASKGFFTVLWIKQEMGGGVCRGDSGGPLFHYNPTTLRYEVLAIVQGGEMWGVTPDVYTDVNDQNIRSWILGGISLSLNLSLNLSLIKHVF